MPNDSSVPDPYDVVLKDVYAQIEQLKQTAVSIELLRASPRFPAQSPAVSASLQSQSENASEIEGGAFLGMTVVDASKKLLSLRRKAMHIAELARLIQAGGVVMTSSEPANTINSILGRRQDSHGDVVKISRGTWGLRDWYPHQNFKKRGSPEPDQVVAAAAQVLATLSTDA